MKGYQTLTSVNVQLHQTASALYNSELLQEHVV
jgi:hypothetical protein